MSQPSQCASGGTKIRAPPPFDGAKHADIIITTSDGVDFYLARIILAMTSPFFDDMFTLTQPPTETSVALHRIKISEDSATFEPLMRLCYPVHRPSIDDLSLLANVLEAAMKYQMEVATELLTSAFRDLIKRHPQRSFEIACRLRLEREAALAAKAWKSMAHDLSDASDTFARTVAGGTYIPQMAKIAAGAYFRLLQYLHGGKIHTFISPPPPPQPLSPEPSRPRSVAGSLPPDVILRSIDGETFPAHTAILRVAQADALLGREDPDAASPQKTREIAVDLNGNIIRAILDFCYPMPYLAPLGLRELALVVEGARRLGDGMQRILDAVKQQMMQHLNTAPLSVYLFAWDNCWDAEAQVAAREVVLRGIRDVYAPEMENVPACLYHALLEFQHRARGAVAAIMRPYMGPPSWISNTLSAIAGDRLETVPFSLSLPLIMKIAPEIQRPIFACPSCEYSHPLGYYGSCDEYSIREQSKKFSDLLQENETVDRDIKNALQKTTLDLPYSHASEDEQDLGRSSGSV